MQREQEMQQRLPDCLALKWPWRTACCWIRTSRWIPSTHSLQQAGCRRSPCSSCRPSQPARNCTWRLTSAFWWPSCLLSQRSHHRLEGPHLHHPVSRYSCRVTTLLSSCLHMRNVFALFPSATFLLHNPGGGTTTRHIQIHRRLINGQRGRV